MDRELLLTLCIPIGFFAVIGAVFAAFIISNKRLAQKRREKGGKASFTVPHGQDFVFGLLADLNNNPMLGGGCIEDSDLGKEAEAGAKFRMSWESSDKDEHGHGSAVTHRFTLEVKRVERPRLLEVLAAGEGREVSVTLTAAAAPGGTQVSCECAGGELLPLGIWDEKMEALRDRINDLAPLPAASLPQPPRAVPFFLVWQTVMNRPAAGWLSLVAIASGVGMVGSAVFLDENHWWWGLLIWAASGLVVLFGLRGFKAALREGFARVDLLRRGCPAPGAIKELRGASVSMQGRGRGLAALVVYQAGGMQREGWTRLDTLAYALGGKLNLLVDSENADSFCCAESALQRVRLSPNRTLAGPPLPASAWLPVVLAVGMCGLFAAFGVISLAASPRVARLLPAPKAVPPQPAPPPPAEPSPAPSAAAPQPAAPPPQLEEEEPAGKNSVNVRGRLMGAEFKADEAIIDKSYTWYFFLKQRSPELSLQVNFSHLKAQTLAEGSPEICGLTLARDKPIMVEGGYRLQLRFDAPARRRSSGWLKLEIPGQDTAVEGDWDLSLPALPAAEETEYPCPRPRQ